MLGVTKSPLKLDLVLGVTKSPLKLDLVLGTKIMPKHKMFPKVRSVGINSVLHVCIVSIATSSISTM